MRKALHCLVPSQDLGRRCQRLLSGPRTTAFGAFGWQRKLHVSWREEFFAPLPPHHTFPMEKYPLLYQLLLAEGLVSAATTLVPDECSWRDLSLVHTAAWLDKFRGHDATQQLSDTERKRLGVPATPRMVQRWRMSVQGTVDAARQVLHAHRRGQPEFSGNVAGGYHHAFAAEGHGFCAFNDVAVAIRVLQRDGLISKALVIDLDTHQGDGTASIFADDQDVFTFSVHARRNFPFDKMKSTLDIELEDSPGDSSYLACIRDSIPQVVTQSAPDICFYLAGVDVVFGDRLGRLSISHVGLVERERFVLGYLFEQKVPTVLLTAGGYAPAAEDLSSAQATANLHAEVFRAAHLIESQHHRKVASL